MSSSWVISNSKTPSSILLFTLSILLKAHKQAFWCFFPKIVNYLLDECEWLLRKPRKSVCSFIGHRFLRHVKQTLFPHFMFLFWMILVSLLNTSMWNWLFLKANLVWVWQKSLNVNLLRLDERKIFFLDDMWKQRCVARLQSSQYKLFQYDVVNS